MESFTEKRSKSPRISVCGRGKRWTYWSCPPAHSNLGRKAASRKQRPRSCRDHHQDGSPANRVRRPDCWRIRGPRRMTVFWSRSTEIGSEKPGGRFLNELSTGHQHPVRPSAPAFWAGTSLHPVFGPIVHIERVRTSSCSAQAERHRGAVG